MGQNLTVHYNRVMYLVEPTDDQKALRGKRINVTESAEGTVRHWYASKQLTAEPFAKDGRVTQQDVADNKLLGSVLAHDAHRPVGTHALDETTTAARSLRTRGSRA